MVGKSLGELDKTDVNKKKRREEEEKKG